MPNRFFSEKHSKLRGFVNVVLYAVATALVTLALATLLSGASSELADRVDRNASVTRAATETVVCILLIDPAERTDAKVRACADANGYSFSP